MTMPGEPVAADITIFTMGFAKKTAREFFDKLKAAGVQRLVDIRLNNVSQLAGFTKKADLEYFLKAILGIEYEHITLLAPTADILGEYKANKGDWAIYEDRFNRLLAERQVENVISEATLDRACLLCSEPTAVKCHRRLVAEYLQGQWGNVTIVHL
jgi:uncharacterized protein (DUF488 family)